MRKTGGEERQGQDGMVDVMKAARQLDIIADLLTIERADPMLVHSYRRIAVRVRKITQGFIEGDEFDNLVHAIPGIQANVVRKVLAIVHGEHPNLLDVLGEMFPPGLSGLLLLPGLGPRRVNLLYNQLGIDSIEKLGEAAAAGELRALPGFGPGLERRLLTTIEHRRKNEAETLGAGGGLHGDATPTRLDKRVM